MRKIYILLLFTYAAYAGNAQQPPIQKLLTDQDRISSMEKRAYVQAASKQQAGSAASANFNVNFYRCEWEVNPTIRYIKGKVTSYFNITTSTNTISYDLHNTLIVDSIKFRNTLLNFTQTPDHALTIQLGTMLPANQRDSLSIYYQGIPANNGFGSFVATTVNGFPVIWTLSEPYGSKDWWPCKNGNTDKADSIDIILSYPDNYSSSSNGLLEKETLEAGRKISYWKHRYPIASYLVAISVTNFIVENDSVVINGRKLPMKMYSYPGYNEFFRTATSIAKFSIGRLSSQFGEYPFIRETYSQTQFDWGGGMEHQTNSFIKGVWDQLIVHELGHQWFGDKVTCRSWEDIWLNEGFATYTEQLYIEEVFPNMRLLYLQYYIDQVVVQPGGSVKVYDTSNVDNIFNHRTTYVKGGILVHMIRWRLGNALFFKAITQYLNDPQLAYGTATTNDLKRNLEQASGQDFTEFFKDWYEGQGYPSYQLQWTPNNNNWIKLKLGQTTSHVSVPFYEMPVPVKIKTGNRDTTFVLNHNFSGQEFWVNPGFTPDSVIFDPERWLLSSNNSVTKMPPASEISNDVIIFPNPSDAEIRITFTNPTPRKIIMRLVNAAGQVTYKKEYNTPGRDEYLEIPAKALSKGVYWLQLLGDDGFKIVRKVIKK